MTVAAQNASRPPGRFLLPSAGRRPYAVHRRQTSLLWSAALLLFASNLIAGSLEDGIVAFNEGRYSTALSLLRRAVDEGRGRPAHIFLALTEAATNDCKSALPSLLPEARNATDQLSLLAGLAAARCQSADGDATSALATLDALKQHFAKNADVLYLSAEIEMTAFNNTTLAMFKDVPSSYRTHQLSAEILEVQGRFADAVSEYRKAIVLNPKAPDLHYRMGRAILLGSHSPEALSQAAGAFTAELQLNPEDSGCYFQLAQVAEVQGHGGDAIAQYEKALQLSPAFVNAMIGLAKIYLQQNETARALPLLEKAATLQPDNEAAHYALLKAYRNSGNMEQAKEQKAILDRLEKPPDSEFSDFLKKLGDKAPQQ